VNQALQSVHLGSLENTRTDPLSFVFLFGLQEKGIKGFVQCGL